MIRAVLFDFDGVIVDTETPTYTSWCDVYREHGVELSIDDWLPAVGTGSSLSGAFDAVAHLERLTGQSVDREAVVSRRSARKLELCERASLLPGVGEYLLDARRLGLATAIVTRNTTAWVHGHCRRLDLEHTWSTIVCANDDPTQDKSLLYEQALRELRVEPAEAVAIEDSPAGVTAAKRARLACVAVPNEITRTATFDDADLVVSSLAEMPLESLLARLPARAVV